MAVTFQDTVSNGTQVNYTIIFPFLDRDHVELKYNGIVQATSLFTFNSDSQIKLVTAAIDGVTVRVGRKTPQTVLTDFQSGFLPEEDLDNAYLQNLYHVQELQDTYDELVAGAAIVIDKTVIKDNDGDTSVETESSSDEDIIRFKTAGVQRGKATSTGWLFSFNDITHDGLVHIQSGSAGAVTANTFANTLVLESDTHMGISLLCPSGFSGGIRWGDEVSNDAARLEYSHSLNRMLFTFAGASILQLSAIIGFDYNVVKNSNANFHVRTVGTDFKLFVDAGTNQVQTRPGTASSGLANIGGALSVNTTEVGTDADTNEKTLMSFVIPANSLAIDGQGVLIKAWGRTVVPTTSVRLRIKIDSIVPVDRTTLTGVAVWAMEIWVYRVGATTCDTKTFLGVWNSAGDLFGGVNAQTVDWSTAITVAVTGQNGASPSANDLICDGLTVEYLA